jgi:hypothetical protein
MPDNAKPEPAPDATPPEPAPATAPPAPLVPPAPEIGGRDGLDPVRYGDWEKGGIAVDF